MMGYSPAKAMSMHAKLELKSPLKPVQPVEEEGDESGQSTETTASPDRVYILASSRTPSPPAIQSWAASPQMTLTPRRPHSTIPNATVSCFNTPRFSLRRQDRQEHLKKELAKLESLERVPTPVKEMDARFYGSIEEAYVSLDAIEKLNKEAVPMAPKLNDAMQGLIIKNYMQMTTRENRELESFLALERDATQQVIRSLEDESATANETLQSTHTRVSELEKELTFLQSQIEELVLETTSKSQEIQDLRLVQDTTSDEVSALMERTAQLSSDTTRLRQERENLLRVNDALSAELKLRPKQLPSVTEDLECQTEADGLLERALAAERESQSLKDANQKTESMLKDSQESVARLSTDLKAQEESALTEREILQRRLQELLNELHIRENEVHTLRDEIVATRATSDTQAAQTIDVKRQMNVLIKENHGLRSVNSTLEESRQTLELGLERADNLVRVLESENAGLHRQMSETGDFKKENEELKAEAAENTLFIETYKTRMEDKYRVLEDDYGTLLSQYQRLSEIFKGQKRLTDQGLLLESVHSLDDVRDLF